MAQNTKQLLGLTVNTNRIIKLGTILPWDSAAYMHYFVYSKLSVASIWDES